MAPFHMARGMIRLPQAPQVICLRERSSYRSPPTSKAAPARPEHSSAAETADEDVRRTRPPGGDDVAPGIEGQAPERTPWIHVELHPAGPEPRIGLPRRRDPLQQVQPFGHVI